MHIYVAECSDHFGGKQLQAGEVIGCVECMGVMDVARTHPGFMNVIRNM